VSPGEKKKSLELVDDLLSLSARERQAEYLREAGMLDAEGLDRLLDAADRLASDDPGKARRLAEACADLAIEADAPVAVPRSAYIRAHVCADTGDFEAALKLINLAHDRYVDLGQDFEALRTNVGLMGVLLELGRYQEALDTGQVVLGILEGTSESNIDSAPQARDLLTASVHQNRGICLEYMGRYDEALDAYASAEERYRSLGMIERLGDISMNRGAILLYLGRGREGISAQETAAVIYEEAGLAAMHAKALVNIGEAHLRLGNYASSLKAFEQARRPLESLGELADRHLLLRHTADAYLELNLYAEALATYQESIGLLRGAGMAHDLAQALWGKGSALIAMSRFEEAEEALVEAADLFAAAGNAPQLSGVTLEQASLQAASGDQKVALATAVRALDLVSEDAYPVHLVYAYLGLADLLLPDAAVAEPHLLTARQIVERLGVPQLRYRVNERLGRLRGLQGRNEEARALLEAAIEDIERLRGTVSLDTARASFLRDKTTAYEELMQLHLAREDEEGSRHAFAVAERAKSRTLVDLLSGVAEARVAPEDPELEPRIRELQAALNATYGQMLAGSVDSEGGALLSDLRARANELEGEIVRLRLQAAATGAATDLFAAPVPLEDLERRLPSEVALLAYHIVGDEVMAFVHADGHVRVARRVGSATRVRRLSQRLAVQWDRFRAGKDFAGRHIALLERSAQQLLAALHAELVAPLEPLLERSIQASGDDRIPRLAVVPHGPLHQVPFHALFDGERYLIERFEISYAPSATVFALCQERESSDSGRALIFGVEDSSIPATVDEARAVAKHLSEAEVRIGDGATVEALRKEVPGCGVLHLASHGLFRADNPMFSSFKLHDGWLMATDVMELDLAGALVALSACESGRSEVIGGDEILGLTRAFLGAGAATLVVGLWIVQDETTASLMERWYARMRDGMGRTAALRAAQLDLKEVHPHPYYWAPFVLIGRR